MANTKVSSEQIIDDVALGGSPTTTTQSASDNSTKVATTAYVTTAVANLVDSAPSSLNTLNELAAAMNDNASFFSTVLPLSGGTMTGDISHASDFTLDVGGDIILDAGGANINFNDDGTAVGHIEMAGQNLEIKAKVADKDIIFKGNDSDGGGTITALTLDMSQAGEADFNGAIKVAGGIVAHQTNRGVFEYSANTFKIRSYGATSGSGAFTISTGGGGGSTDTVALTIDSSQNSTFAGTISATKADLRNNSSGAETDALILRNYAAGADTATAIKFFPTQSTSRFASIVAENVDGNNNISLSFLTSAGDTPSAALTINQNRNATFSGTISSGAITSSGTVTGQKLVSTDGVLELDDNGTHNGIINVPASLRINIDSDNNNTGEAFQIGNNVTNISNSNILFKVAESGDVEISNAGDLTLKNPNAAPTNSVSAPGSLIFQGSGWDSNVGSKPIRAKIVHSASYGDHGSGATQGALIFYMQGAGGLDSSPDTQQEAMRLDAGGAYHTGHPNLGINTSDIFNTLHVRGDSGQEAESLISVSSGGSTDYIDLYKVHGSYPHRGGGRLRALGMENNQNVGYVEYMYAYSRASNGTYYINLKLIDEAYVNNTYGRPRLYLTNASSYNTGTNRQTTDQTANSTNVNILRVSMSNVANQYGTFQIAAEPFHWYT